MKTPPQPPSGILPDLLLAKNVGRGDANSRPLAPEASARNVAACYFCCCCLVSFFAKLIRTNRRNASARSGLMLLLPPSVDCRQVPFMPAAPDQSALPCGRPASFSAFGDFLIRRVKGEQAMDT